MRPIDARATISWFFFVIPATMSSCDFMKLYIHQYIMEQGRVDLSAQSHKQAQDSETTLLLGEMPNQQRFMEVLY